MHLIEKKWNISELSEEQKALPIERRLLCARGITDHNKQDAFLSERPVFHDPFLLPDMQKACVRILEAVKENERILIYGDYDADGVTATTMLMRYFRTIGKPTEYLIPNRVTEGYGISDAVFDDILQKKPDLIITVDCGIANAEEILSLSQNGIDFIVTDHHEVKDILPEAHAVICPKRKDSQYPVDYLCGAGVAFKLIQALMLTDPTLKPKDSDGQDYCDLAMIGTVADVVPLLDENRSIVKRGLDIAQRQPGTGLKLLLTALVDDPSQLSRSLLSFSVIPKINASGRMGDAGRAVQLFLSEDPEEASIIVRELLEDNRKRQEEEKEILEQAYEQINELYKTENAEHICTSPIIVYGEDWHPGIVGIVASRIVARYNRSAIVLSGRSGQDGIIKGSARASYDYSILDAVSYAKAHLVQFGGHTKAAGITLRADQLENFKMSVREYAQNVKRDSGDVILDIDLELDVSEISLETWNALNRLEPFGEGHPEPRFLVRSAAVDDVLVCGEGQHLRLSVRLQNKDNSEAYRFNVIAFRWGYCAGMFQPGDYVDIVFEMKKNVWRGNEKLDLIAYDIRISKRGHILFDQPEIPEKLFRNQLPLKSISNLAKTEIEKLLPDRKYIKTVYQFIQKHCQTRVCMCDFQLLSDWISSDQKKSSHAFALARVFDIFEEAGLIKVYYRENMRVCFSLLFVKGKVKLENTKTFQLLSASGGAIK